MNWKTFREVSEPLEDMSYERFLRIVGLFEAIPAEDLTRHAAMVEQFRKKAQAIEALVSPDKSQFMPGDASDHVHNLQLLLIQLLPLEILTSFIPGFREDFRDAVGDAIYQRYFATQSSSQLRSANLSQEALERLTRADALYLVNETRRQTLAQRHIEETRVFLLQTLARGWRRVVVPLFLVLCVFFFCKSVADLYIFSEKHPAEKSKGQQSSTGGYGYIIAHDRNRYMPTPEDGSQGNSPDSPTPTQRLQNPISSAAYESPWESFVDRVGSFLIQGRRSDFGTGDHEGNLRELPDETAAYQMLIAAALLSSAAIAGACGAFISVVNRIQRITDSSRIARNIWVLKNSSASVAYAPAVGATFALVLSVILAGGLISGSLFPDLSNKSWIFTLWHPTDMAKWLVWAFIAGFSERLVPDMLDRLTARVMNEDKSELIATPSPKIETLASSAAEATNLSSVASAPPELPPSKRSDV